MSEINAYKSRLRDYLSYRGIEVRQAGGVSYVRCPNPAHEDKNPSATVYDDNHKIHCHKCDKGWDIYDLVGLLDGHSSIAMQLNEVKKAFGDSKEPDVVQPTLVPVSDAVRVFAKTKLQRFVDKGWSFVKAWPFLTEDGEHVEIVDIRYERKKPDGKTDKRVKTVFLNKTGLQAVNRPLRIFGKELLAKYPDHKILIVEGAKTATAAKPLIKYGFIPMTWNGGSGAAKKINWDIISGRDIYIFPDDDEGGQKAAKEIAKSTGGRIVDIVKEARRVKPKAADIVEVLQVKTAAELAEHILKAPASESESKPKSLPEQKKEKKKREKKPKPPRPTKLAPTHFKILGISEGSAFFLDRHDVLYGFKIDTLNKGKLLRIAPLSYWEEQCGTDEMRPSDWVVCQDLIIEAVGHKNYDPDLIRGRGAWREDDGRLCYHDGVKTVGEYSHKWIFLRKTPYDIGIGDRPAAQDVLDNIYRYSKKLTLKEEIDVIRLLSWSTIAPFAGCLPLRPQAFLTGDSQGGKSTITKYIVRRITGTRYNWNGGDSTDAGIRQMMRNDSGAIILDEFDVNTLKKADTRMNLLSMMRQSTSDDAPMTVKGTADQIGITYTMRSMFFFAAISPEFENIADQNRMTMINVVKPKRSGEKWSLLEAKLNKYITEENCRGIRALTWEKLPDIILLSKRITNIIQDELHLTHRFAASEGLLLAAHFIVWLGINEPTDEDISTFIFTHYMKDDFEDRNDADELLHVLMEHKVRVQHRGNTVDFSVGECCRSLLSRQFTVGEHAMALMPDDEIGIKRAIENIGIAITRDGELAVANNHSKIKQILNRSTGYSKLLKRHPKCHTPSKNVHLVSGQKQCCIFKDLDIFEE